MSCKFLCTVLVQQNMDVTELFSCCRSGDIEKVRFLVEQRDIDVNIRDKWDSTPLYYACLCGHSSVVEYLIGVGARCEANTFDGERCLYGALTDEIRRMLTQHNLITVHTIRRDAYNEFLRRLYESGEESDVAIVVNGREFGLHRCILAARSPYFCHMFSSKWRRRKKVIINNDKVDSTAFACVMRYLYTGRLECSFEMTDCCLSVGNNCKLPMFKQLLIEAIQRAKILQLQKQGRVRITTVVIEPEDCPPSVSVDSDLRDLAQTTLPPELRVWPTEMPFCQREMPALADVCFMVEGLAFICHKMFFCPRSEYFRALFRDHFHETEWTGEASVNQFLLPTLTLHHVSAKVFGVIVTYLYCNQMMADDDTVVEVLQASEMFLLPGLKRQCGVFLGTKLSVSTVFSIHRLARLFSLARLEDLCVAYVARNFTQVADQDQLREIILSDAQEVKGRQETDSVTFVDELRFHLSSNLCNISDIVEAKDKLSLLEDILEDLGIEA